MSRLKLRTLDIRKEKASALVHRIFTGKKRGKTKKEKPEKGEVEGRESSRGKPTRRGKCRFLPDLLLSTPAGFPSRNNVTEKN